MRSRAPSPAPKLITGTRRGKCLASAPALAASSFQVSHSPPYSSACPVSAAHSAAERGNQKKNFSGRSRASMASKNSWAISASVSTTSTFIRNYHYRRVEVKMTQRGSQMPYSSNHRILMLMPLLAALCGSAFAAAQPPKLRLSEVQDIAPARYRVELTLDPTKDSFSGVISIEVNLKQPAQTIWLNANQITVEEASASSGGKTWQAQTVPGGSDFVGLQFPSALPVGPAEITIRCQGSVRHGDTSGIFRTRDGDIDYIFTQFESTDARDAFPCFDEPSYKTPWQLTLHVPAQDAAVSNTPVASEKSENGVKRSEERRVGKECRSRWS